MSYGFILQREKITGTLVSTYIGIVITQMATPYVQQFFAGETTVGSVFIKASPTPFIIKTAILAIVIVLLTTKAGLTGMRGRGLLSPIEVALYSALTSAIILATVLGFLDEGARATLASGSQLAGIVIQYHDVWLLAPVIVLIVMGFRRVSYSDD